MPCGRRSLGKRQTSSRPSELGDRRWPVGLEPGREHWGLTLAKAVWDTPGDVHFSQDHCYPLILHPTDMQWSEQTERPLIEQNNHLTEHFAEHFRA